MSKWNDIYLRFLIVRVQPSLYALVLFSAFMSAFVVLPVQAGTSEIERRDTVVFNMDSGSVPNPTH